MFLSLECDFWWVVVGIKQKGRSGGLPGGLGRDDDELVLVHNLTGLPGGTLFRMIHRWR